MIFIKELIFDEQKTKDKRGLNTNGKVQQFIDSECIRLMDNYTPFQSGVLKGAANIQTTIGSGIIVQQTPYAKRWYYENANFNEAPRRGNKWFERMKQNHKSDILKGAAAIAGAKK